MNNDNYLVINDQGLAEVSPTASRDLQQAFIDTYRETQAGNTAQIGEAAHALGSDLPAQYGGLHGPSDYIKSRYQTPQTESRIAGLKTAAQLSALNQLMQNEQAKWADKYNQAYRNYQKRATSGGGNGGGNNGGVDTQAYDQYDSQDTIGVSSDLDKLLPEGANRITVVGANGAYSDGYPSTYVTADNTNGSMKDTVVGTYGIPAKDSGNNFSATDILNTIRHFASPVQRVINDINYGTQFVKSLFGGN